MSPDLKVRRRVRQRLDQRPQLSAQEWTEQYCQLQGIAVPIATFAYHHLQRYSGLEVGRLRLDDRLEADLHWSQICWFDWTFTLCQDFCQNFSIALEEPFHAADFDTLGDLLIALNCYWTEQAAQLEQEQFDHLPIQES